MSDIASLGRLRPSSAQLPVSWYVEPEIFALMAEIWGPLPDRAKPRAASK